MKKKLAVIIPFYNEEENILNIINEWSTIINKNQMDLILINDGSTDKSLNLLKKNKKKYNNLILINKKNGGHGSAIIKGYSFAAKKNYKFVFQTDSDDQFTAKNFNNLWTKRNLKFDLILGNRKNRNDTLIRIFLSNYILKPFLKKYFGKKTIDPNIPYRLMNVNFLKKFLKTINKDYVAPNILMTLYSKNEYVVNIDHSIRITGELKWSIARLIKFGFKLLYDLYKYKKKFDFN